MVVMSVIWQMWSPFTRECPSCSYDLSYDSNLLVLCGYWSPCLRLVVGDTSCPPVSDASLSVKKFGENLGHFPSAT